MALTRLVLVHEIILTRMEGTARRASLAALDALEGDSDFLARTCDCRSKSNPTKREREEAQQLLKLEEDEREMLAVEDELMEV
jgi:endoribonuclease Dicer